jgi:3D (Asp-Asp-Asp) domain-containing protein
LRPTYSPTTATAAAYRRLALFPVPGAVAVAASNTALSSFGGFTRAQSLLPLPGARASRPIALNAPLWALVSLTVAFSLLWSTTLGQAGTQGTTAATPLVAVPLAASLVAVAERASYAAELVRRTAAAFPQAQSVILARLPGRHGSWTLVEVDGHTVYTRDPAQVEAALTAAGFRLEEGDRVIALPNSGRRLVQRAIPFSVVDGGVPFSGRAAADTIGEALAAIGIDLRTADIVQPPEESPLLPGVRISVLRAQPVAITALDVQIETRSRAATVGDLLAEAQVPLGPLDRVEPPLEAALPAYGTVRLVRVREEELTELQPVPFQVSLQYSGDLAPGARYRIRPGTPGLLERVVKVVFEDEVEVRRFAVSERLVREVVNEIVIAARPVLPQISIPAIPAPHLPTVPTGPLPDVPVKRVLTMVATAYDPGPISTGKWPGHPAYGITATGMRATYGVVAVDPSVIPLYTRLYIPGYGYAIAADTGGAIKGNRIDLFYPTYGEAIAFGRRTLPVYILE